MNDHTMIRPEGWPAPKGYENGVLVPAGRRLLFVAGQIGWTPQGVFEAEDFVGQFRQALENVKAVVEAAGGTVADVVRLTVYVTDLDAYRNNLRPIGQAWREVIGKHFPAMAVVGTNGLVEPKAMVEIEATAAIA